MAKRIALIGATVAALVLVAVIVVAAFALRPTEAPSAPLVAPTLPLAASATVVQAGAASPTAVSAYDAASPSAEAAPGEPPPTEALSASSGPILFEIVPAESEARFSIGEVLRGQPVTAVGTTDQVAGQLAVDPTDPSSAQVGTILINARDLETDQGQRNNAIRRFILSTDQFEFIQLVPTALAGLPESVSVGTPFTFQLSGDLTIRDQTRPTTWEVTVTPVSEGRLEGSATTTIRYAEWGLAIPQVPSVASVDETVGLALEFVATTP